MRFIGSAQHFLYLFRFDSSSLNVHYEMLDNLSNRLQISWFLLVFNLFPIEVIIRWHEPNYFFTKHKIFGRPFRKIQTLVGNLMVYFINQKH